MRFKLDENLPLELAADLHRLGHEADTVIGEGLRGAPDPAIVEAASTADRILLTLDKGIADLRRYPIHRHAGLVLFRPNTSGRAAVMSFVRGRLGKLLDLDLKGRLVVVGPSRIRFRQRLY